ncbi:MAG: crossover junction endodeoxyribonuclease RuvC [Rhodothermales bacterium]|jgi:crossover junction endodeoxyribonuclease RuvC
MILLGVDTALRCTGYGVIELQGKQFRAIDCGVVRNTPKMRHSECLRRVAGGIREIVKTFAPEVASIEGGFFAKNAKTSMVLGMARGAVVSELACAGIDVYEYAPRRVKQAVVGYGNASKGDVAITVARMLGINVTDIPDDATDALAVALCHALTAQGANGIYLPDPL